MSTRKAIIIVWFICIFANGAVIADASCYQSINIDKDKNLTYFGWVPGTGQYIGTLSCRAAEALRQDSYAKGINIKIFDSYQNLEKEMTKIFKELDTNVAKLKEAVAKNKAANVTAAIAKIVAYELGKAGTIATCLSPEPFTKAFCVGGVMGTAFGTQEILSGNVMKTFGDEEIKQIEQEIAIQKERFEGLKKKQANLNLGEMKVAYTKLFLGLCTAIKNECLK